MKLKSHLWGCAAARAIGVLLLVLMAVAIPGDVWGGSEVRDVAVVSRQVSGDTLDLMSMIGLDSDLVTFRLLLIETGLDSVLCGEGPLTVLAPDDSAFIIMGSGRLDSLRADSGAIRELIGRHLIPDRTISFENTGKIRATTLDGEEIAILVDEEVVSIREAYVIDEEITCANGVIHVIDRVLTKTKRNRRG